MLRPRLSYLHGRGMQNMRGEFYVDFTGIDCDTCRQIAPGVFRDHGGQSSVYRQPRDERERLLATMALVACPTASIGARTKIDARAAAAAFRAWPTNVFFCEFTSESSFGGWSYLVTRRPEEGGNLLVDSPRFTAPLMRRIAEMGGVGTMFLTHRDDIADHVKLPASSAAVGLCTPAMALPEWESNRWSMATIQSYWHGSDCSPYARTHAGPYGAALSARFSS